MFKYRRLLNLSRLLIGSAILLSCVYLSAHFLLGEAAGAALAVLAIVILVGLAVQGKHLILYRCGARRVAPAAAPQIMHVLECMALKAGLPAVPALYLAPDTGCRVFAVGWPRDSAIVITESVLKALSFRELQSVLAHEVSHITHLDSLFMGVGAPLRYFLLYMLPVPAMMLLANLFEPGLLNPSTVNGLALWLGAALLVIVWFRLSVGWREPEADAAAVALTGDVEALVSALQVLSAQLNAQPEGGWQRDCGVDGEVHGRLVKLLAMRARGVSSHAEPLTFSMPRGELDCLVDLDRELRRLLPISAG